MTYKGGWSSPEELEYGYGYWIKVDKDSALNMEINSSAEFKEDDTKGWVLYGVVKTLDVTSLKKSQKCLIYVNPAVGWINAPETIYPGQAFWSKQ